MYHTSLSSSFSFRGSSTVLLHVFKVLFLMRKYQTLKIHNWFIYIVTYKTFCRTMFGIVIRHAFYKLLCPIIFWFIVYLFEINTHAHTHTHTHTHIHTHTHTLYESYTHTDFNVAIFGKIAKLKTRAIVTNLIHAKFKFFSENISFIKKWPYSRDFSKGFT